MYKYFDSFYNHSNDFYLFQEAQSWKEELEAASALKVQRIEDESAEKSIFHNWIKNMNTISIISTSVSKKLYNLGVRHNSYIYITKNIDINSSSSCIIIVMTFYMQSFSLLAISNIVLYPKMGHTVK